MNRINEERHPFSVGAGLLAGFVISSVLLVRPMTSFFRIPAGLVNLAVLGLTLWWPAWAAGQVNITGVVVEPTGSAYLTSVQVSVAVNGQYQGSVSSDGASGTFTIPNVPVDDAGANDVVVIYIDDETEKGSTILLADRVAGDIFVDVALEHFRLVNVDHPAIATPDLAIADNVGDPDIGFSVDAGNAVTLDAGRSLEMFDGAAFTASGSVTVGGDLSIADGTGFTVATGSILTVPGDLTVGGALDANGAAEIAVAGDFTGDATSTFTNFSVGPTILLMNGNGSQTLGRTGGFTGGNELGTLEVDTSADSLTFGSAAEFTGGATIVGGTVKVENPVTIAGAVTNDGTLKNTGSTLTILDTFTNNAALISDPADNFFTDLIVADPGFLAGGLGDNFFVSSDLENHSLNTTDWETALAALTFDGGPTHSYLIGGADLGPSTLGLVDNFAWGSLSLASGEALVLGDGNLTPGGAAYVNELLLADGLAHIGSITGNGLSIYYNADAPGNAYLGGGTFALSGGGVVAPFAAVVPEPSTFALAALALLSLGLVGRRRRVRGVTR